MKLYEYSNKKDQIRKLRLDLLKQLEQEETDLLKSLDSESVNEQK